MRTQRHHTWCCLDNHLNGWGGKEGPTDRPTDRPTKPFVGRPPGSGKKHLVILSSNQAFMKKRYFTFKKTSGHFIT